MFLTQPTARFPHFEWAPTEVYGRFALEALAKYFEEKWARHATDVIYTVSATSDIPKGEPIASAPLGLGEDELDQLASDPKVLAALDHLDTHDPQPINIRVALVKRERDLNYYVASLAPRQSVTPHAHLHGDETYVIMSGSGRMRWGPLSLDDGVVEWRDPAMLVPTSRVVVPEGWAHSLENISDNDLLFLLATPEAHMVASDEGGDRFMLRQDSVST
jgi:mannose-6-phosphate isomerase-like protein (cupin superfamily)